MASKVKDIMTSDPACCTPQTPLRDVAKMMKDNDCGEIPVISSSSDRRPIGVVTDRDIVVRAIAAGINPMDQTAEHCMSQPVVTVKPEGKLDEVCDLMEEHQIRRVPVVDDRGQLIGIVSQADVALAAGRRATGEVVQEVSQPGHSRH